MCEQQQSIARAIPLVQRSQYDCAWCWKAMHPGTPFPVGLSSNICKPHANWMATQAGLRRQQKATKQEGK